MPVPDHPNRVNLENNRLPTPRPNNRRGSAVGGQVHVMPPHGQQPLPPDQRQNPRHSPVKQGVGRLGNRQPELNLNRMPLISPNPRPGGVERVPPLVIGGNHKHQLAPRDRKPIPPTSLEERVNTNPPTRLQHEPNPPRPMPQMHGEVLGHPHNPTHQTRLP